MGEGHISYRLPQATFTSTWQIWRENWVLPPRVKQRRQASSTVKHSSSPTRLPPGVGEFDKGYVDYTLLVVYNKTSVLAPKFQAFVSSSVSYDPLVTETNVRHTRTASNQTNFAP